MKKAIFIKDIKALDLKNDPNIIFLRESMFDDLDIDDLSDEEIEAERDLELQKSISRITKNDIAYIIKALYEDEKFEDFQEQIGSILERKGLFYFDHPKSAVTAWAQNVLKDSVPSLKSVLNEILIQLFDKKDIITYQYFWSISYNGPKSYQQALKSWLMIKDMLYPRLQDLINYLIHNIIKDDNYYAKLQLSGNFRINNIDFNIFEFSTNYVSDTVFYTIKDMFASSNSSDKYNNLTLSDVLEYLKSGEFSFSINTSVENNLKSRLLTNLNDNLQRIRISYTTYNAHSSNNIEPIKGLKDIFDNCIPVLEIVAQQLSASIGQTINSPYFKLILFEEYINDKTTYDILKKFINENYKNPKDILDVGFIFSKENSIASFDGTLYLNLKDQIPITYTVFYDFRNEANNELLNNTLSEIMFKNTNKNFDIVIDGIEDKEYYTDANITYRLRDGIPVIGIGASIMKNYAKTGSNISNLFSSEKIFNEYKNIYDVSKDEIMLFKNKEWPGYTGRYIKYVIEASIKTMKLKDILDILNNQEQ